MFRRQICLFALVGCIGLLVTALPAAADGPKGSAVIKGKVVLEGTPPKIQALSMSGDATCSASHKKPVPSQGLIVYKQEGNAVPFAFVYVKKGVSGKYDPPEKPAEIDQIGCMYEPHVFGMVSGQELNILNSDPVNHNIHSLAKKNPAFNFAQPNKGMIKKLVGSQTFTKPEVMIKVKCDVHAWMSCYVGVLNHPFFDVTKSHFDTKDKAARGTFEIAELPAGDYELEVWHETFGTVTQKVSVKDGESKEIEIKLSSKSAAAPPTRTVELASVSEAGESAKACCKMKAAAKADGAESERVVTASDPVAKK